MVVQLPMAGSIIISDVESSVYISRSKLLVACVDIVKGQGPKHILSYITTVKTWSVLCIGVSI
jgi:hypothetical protein